MPTGKRNHALPYLTLASGTVTASDWTWSGPPGTAIEEAVVRGWDPAVVFSLARTVVVDVEKLVEDLRLDGAISGVECVVTASTAGRKSRWVVARRPVGESEEGGGIDFHLQFDSARLADSLTLTTGIYLTAGLSGGQLLSPSRAGSRLWEETQTFVLEGTAPRPAMRVHSFSESYRYDGLDKARFYIEIRAQDADEPFRSSVVINLNADLPDFVAAISGGEAEATRELFEATVRAVVVHALFNDLVGSDEPQGTHEGTIGRTAADWLKLCFPDEGQDSLRKRSRSDPGEFEARLQSRLADILARAAK